MGFQRDKMLYIKNMDNLENIKAPGIMGAFYITNDGA